MAIDARMSEREYTKFTESATTPGEVVVKVANVDGSEIASGDIEIGAVEIKDHDSDTRVNVNGSNQMEVAEANSTAILADTTAILSDTTAILSDTTGILADTTTIAADTTTIASDTTSIDGKITACDTGTVTIATELPAGTQNIGDVDVATLPALSAGTNNIGYTAMFRRSDAIQATITSSDATAATQVVAKVAAKNIYVTDIVISTDTALNVQLQDDAAAVLMEQIYLPAVSVWSKTFSTPLMVATNQDLDVIASVAGNISVTVTGYQV